MKKQDTFWKYVGYFILINTFVFILIAYWFMISHLMFSRSTDKVDIIPHKSGLKVVRVYHCSCNRVLCYLEDIQLINVGCRVKKLYTIK